MPSQPPRRRQMPNKVAAPPSSSQRRRGSLDAWNCLRGAVERQRLALAAADPSSPRIRPTVGSLFNYIPFDRIKDERNAEPTIHRGPKVHPHAFLSVGLEVEIPAADDIEPLPVAVGFDARQAFNFVFFGEKSSLEEILIPIAEQIDADLYVGTGEISDTLLWQIAKNAIEDGRHLVVFALTDWSGWQMAISIGRKLDLLFRDLRWELVAVALTPDQVRKLGLPEEPIKRGDKRAAAWEQAFGVKQTEIDALTTPEMQQRGILDEIVGEAIRPYIDETLRHRVDA